LRDGWQQIADKAKVFGVSIDSIRSHDKFIRKHALPFPILSDESHSMVEAYGVWVEKSLYGRHYMGTERTTFVIGPDGIIKAVLAKVKPAEHLARVLERL
jgi:peroxiredoxin Q/BCP